MTILALDLATSTGWAYGRGDSLPTAGAWRMPQTGHDCGTFGAVFWRFLDPLARRLALEAQERGERLTVVFEAPILPEKKWNAQTRRMEGGTNIETTRKLQGLAMLVEVCCYFLSAPPHLGGEGLPVDCREVAIATVKKELTGNGRADKGEMLAVARRIGVPLPPGDEAFDVADAVGIWLVGVRYYAKQHLSRWDAKLWGARHGA